MNKLNLFFISLIMLVLVSTVASALSIDYAWMDNTTAKTTDLGNSENYDLFVQPDTFILKELKIQGSLYKIEDGQTITVEDNLFTRYPTNTFYEEFTAEPYDYNNEPGEYIYRVTVEQWATDGGYKLRTREIFLTVKGEPQHENLPPYFISTPVTEGMVGEQYYYDANAVDPESDPIEYALVTKPSGMTINKDNGVISWAPTSKGTYNVKVSVTDNIEGNAPAYQEYQIVVDEKELDNEAPKASFTISDETPKVGDQIELLSTSTDDKGITRYVWNIDGSVTEGTTGVYYKPLESREYTFSLTVYDAEGLKDTATKTIFVSPKDNTAPSVDFSWQPSTVCVGDEVTFSTSSYDADGDELSFTWNLDGKTFDTKDGLKYTFNEAKTYDVSVKAFDGTDYSETVTKSVEVDSCEENFPPYFTTTPLTKAYVNEEYIYDANATDPEDKAIAFKVESRPEGEYVFLNKFTGRFEWTPTAVGDYDFVISVTDHFNNPVNQSFTIKVEKREQENKGPTADFYWTTPVYLEELVTLTSNSTDSDGSIVSENWDVQGETKTGNPITHRFSQLGNVPVTLTVKDNDGATDTITKNVYVIQRELVIDHFSCNEDVDDDGDSEVVAGEELMCVAHIKDNIKDVTIKFDWNGDGQFEECVTDFKGQCSSTIIVDEDQTPDVYRVYAEATKPNWKKANAGPVLVEVWKQRYKIINLQVFEDEFETEQDTFYRKTPMYISFDVVDDLTGKIVVPGVDDNVIDFVYLKVKGGGAEFDEWTIPMSMKSMTPDYSNEIRYKTAATAAGFGAIGTPSGIDDTGLHKFVLDEIPITDDFLGEGKVFAFTFNFTDKTAGEATKNVNILNNELTFEPPERVKLVPGEPIFMDMKNYVRDVETPKDEVLFTYGNTGHLNVNPQGDGTVFKIYADEGQTEATTVLFTADDTDGSVVTKGIEFYIDAPIIVEKDPVAVLRMPSKAMQDELVTLDGSDSYDEDGTIVEYSWKITSQNKIVYEETGVHNNKLLYAFSDRALYHVTLTVKDNDGNTASATGTIEITEKKEEENDADNEDGIWVDRFDIYGTHYGTISIDEPYFVTVKVRNERSEPAKNVRVSFSIPELGYKDSANTFKLRANGDSETITFGGELPFTAAEVPEGEYIALITVKTGDILRSKYYPLYIE